MSEDAHKIEVMKATPKDLLNVATKDGKHTVRQLDDGRLVEFRYAEEWRDLSGDKLVYSLASDLEETRAEYQKLSKQRNRALDIAKELFWLSQYADRNCPRRDAAIESYNTMMKEIEG